VLVIVDLSVSMYYFNYKQVYSAGEIENVRVAVRLRPLSKKEKLSGCIPVVVADSENAVVYVQNPNPSHIGPPKTFMFDLVFDSDSKQVSKHYLINHINWLLVNM
jgi:kinesin family protein 3/17